MPSAKLYTVQTLRGTVFAVHDLSSDTIWTERSEQAARQSALERRVSIIEEKFVSHDELLRLMGHEPPLARPPARASSPALTVDSIETGEAVEALEPVGDAASGAIPAEPLSSAGIPVRYHWEDEDEPIAPFADDSIILPRTASPPMKNVFCSEGLVADSISPPVDIGKTQNIDGHPGRPQKPD